jgi:hypothetical protein
VSLVPHRFLLRTYISLGVSRSYKSRGEDNANADLDASDKGSRDSDEDVAISDKLTDVGT